MELFILLQVMTMTFFLVAYLKHSETLWVLTSVMASNALTLIMSKTNTYIITDLELIIFILLNSLLLALSLFYLTIDIIDKYATNKDFRREE